MFTGIVEEVGEVREVTPEPGSGVVRLVIEGRVVTADARHGDSISVNGTCLTVVEALARATDIPLDCHLMIDDPDRWALGYAEAGAHNVTVHVEAARDPACLAANLRAAGAKAGLSVKPDTPLEPYLELLRHYDTLLVMSVEPGFGGQEFIADVLDKVRTARGLVDTGHLKVLVEIDGGINSDTIEQAAEAGVDCFVAGSAVYGADEPDRAITALRELAANAAHRTA